jgi:CheY-like chemotaxis protein/anti-sigma regulatory factor (Ser/Thr protein kinase)
MNLAINARDAMPGGGTMTIETRSVPSSTEDEPGGDDTPSGQAFVRLIVSDEGEGIDETTRLHIFDPFFTTRGDVRGTGLGLATVYGIVKQHRGEIYVESRKGYGSSFHVFLPASTEPVSTLGAEESASASPAAVRGGTVLVVEDEDSVRLLVKRLLERNGFTVVEASSGEAAIAAMESMPAPPRLLLTDIVMPKMNGPEVAERILARWPHVRVLYTSGYADDVRGAEGLVRTGKNLLEKPFSEASLLEKIDAALRGAPGDDSET